MSNTSSPGIIVVPHTHWDREWYEPHDVFRLRLVHMVDGLLDLLEAEPQYRFTLDGQSAAIDDYLEMRPTQIDRVRRAVKAGQLALGPFLILLDEFGCDGETIIRNLELGIRSARRLGSEMRVGYLPDMFGHAGQTPQILRGFGIHDAGLWRGVPARIHHHAFRWEALNGDSVRCQYLFDGYGNGLDLFAIPGQLPELAAQYVEETRNWYQGDNVLAMLGSDHSLPKPDLVEVVNAANADPNCPTLSIGTLQQYIDTCLPESKLETVRGELCSHARGNLLPGVFSIRTNLKAAMAEAERSVNVAERLDTLFPSQDHQSFLDKAWYRIVESSAHDSVTGCGVDPTAEQVETRLHTASHIARGVTQTALKKAAEDVSASDYLILNPSSFARESQVELTAGGVSLMPDNAQILGSFETNLGNELLRTHELEKILHRIHGRELFGQQINDYQWSENQLSIDVAEVPVGEFDLAAFTAELREKVSSSDPNKEWSVLTTAAPRHRVLVQASTPGLGVNLASNSLAPSDPVRVDGNIMSNRFVSVALNDDGTVDVTGENFAIHNALRLVDEGDRGDSYNYGPTSNASALTEPVEVKVESIETGPLRARVRIRRDYLIPESLNQSDLTRRSDALARLSTTTYVELRSSEPFVRVTVSFVNTASNHRLRILVPAGERRLESSASAGQYGVTVRGRTGEGGWGEFPLPTFPATQFVNAGISTVLVKKLTEYELLTPADPEAEDQLALTVLRAVGMMSVNLHPLRDEPAGSEIPVPGAQYLGQRVVTELAILPSPNGWVDARAAKFADLYRLDPLVVRGGKPVDPDSQDLPSVLPDCAVSLETEGSVPVTSLRALRNSDGSVLGLEARMVNYGPTSSNFNCFTDRDWVRSNMAGEEEPSEAGLSKGANKCSLAPSTIATFRF